VYPNEEQNEVVASHEMKFGFVHIGNGQRLGRQHQDCGDGFL